MREYKRIKPEFFHEEYKGSLTDEQYEKMKQKINSGEDHREFWMGMASRAWLIWLALPVFLVLKGQIITIPLLLGLFIFINHKYVLFQDYDFESKVRPKFEPNPKYTKKVKNYRGIVMSPLEELLERSEFKYENCRPLFMENDFEYNTKELRYAIDMIQSAIDKNCGISDEDFRRLEKGVELAYNEINYKIFDRKIRIEQIAREKKRIEDQQAAIEAAKIKHEEKRKRGEEKKHNKYLKDVWIYEQKQKGEWE